MMSTAPRCLAVALGATTFAEAADMVRRGSNEDPRPGQPVPPPCAMQDRPEARAPLVTFMDCTMWETVPHNMEATLCRTRDRQL